MDVPRLYRDSDLFVFPSIAESFGHPLVEAMASGLPILASDIPVCREICGEAAIYFDPFNAKSLAEAIVHLEKDITLRKRLGEAGRRRAESKFNWADHVDRLVHLIEEVGADA
jgi:glycosyltransferase involved in cell wall biosynthesis